MGYDTKATDNISIAIGTNSGSGNTLGGVAPKLGGANLGNTVAAVGLTGAAILQGGMNPYTDAAAANADANFISAQTGGSGGALTDAGASPGVQTSANLAGSVAGIYGGSGYGGPSGQIPPADLATTMANNGATSEQIQAAMQAQITAGVPGYTPASAYASAGGAYTANTSGYVDTAAGASGNSGAAGTGAAGGAGSLAPYALPAALIGSALIGSNASNNGAAAVNAGTTAAINAQTNMFNTVKTATDPYNAAGKTATNQLSTMTAPGGSLVSGFTNADLNSNLAPNYKFQLDQGLAQTANNANLQTGLVSGNAMMAGNQYAQNYAGNAYQNAFSNFNTTNNNIYSRLSGIAQSGIQANQTLAGAATGAANGISNAAIAGGNATAAGIVGTGNAISNGLVGAAALLSGYNPSVASAAAGTNYSDARLKTNIVMVGKTVFDLPLFTWNYIWDLSKRYRGVMSVDVAKILPDAVTVHNGFNRVNYKMLGIEMAEV
jgi:hypothetical protein